MKKLLFIAAIAALGVAAPPPVEAAKANCWFQMEPGAEQLKGASCEINERKNANNHLVYDIIERNGYKRTVVLWSHSGAEVFSNGHRFYATWSIDEDGDVYLVLNKGGEWAFRPKNISAVPAPPGPRQDLYEMPTKVQPEPAIPNEAPGLIMQPPISSR